MKKFKILTIQDVQTIICKIATSHKFTVVIDRKLGGQNFVELTSSNQQINLYIESLDSKAIKDFGIGIKSELNDTNFQIARPTPITHKSQYKYSCIISIQDIANRG